MRTARSNPTWESLKQYKTPDWFRDAKFGIWAHWSAQCVPEQGDWYARNMYLQGSPQYNFHVQQYGHPSKFGFMEIDNLWKAEKWDPEALMDRYVKAGAKYFVALANHHDNLDCYDSTHHAWNSVRVGPKKDIVGTWARIARRHNLRFGVTNHSAHSWHWFQPAYAYDPEGPMAGVPTTASPRRKAAKANGGRDSTPRNCTRVRTSSCPMGSPPLPRRTAGINRTIESGTRRPQPTIREFVETWFLRCKELVDKYQPDLLYFDNTELPLGQAGLDIAAHLYNSSIKRHAASRRGPQFERAEAGARRDHGARHRTGRADRILPAPWQTDTCIGDWHYRRSLYEQHRYKTARQVVQMLVDIVSKNGNLLLNIPMRGDGSIDEDEQRFLDGVASWMPANGEAIFGTRPFTVFGEGAPDVSGTANFNENRTRAYTARDIRFTTKGETLYATALAWPEDGKLTIATLGRDRTEYPKRIGRVELLGSPGALSFTREANGLVVTLPATKPNEFAFVLKILPA